MTPRIGRAHLIMLTTFATLAGRASSAADWSGNLEAAANAGYVTNPALEQGSHVSDESAVLTVDGSTIAQTERGQLSITPRFSATRYDEEHNLDYTSGSIDLTSVENLERGQWSVSAAALTDSTLTSERGLTGLTNVNRRHDFGSLTLGYLYSSSERLSWQLQGAGQVTHYSDAEQFALTDYHYGALVLGPVWSFSERMQGSLIVEADRLVPKEGSPQNDYSVSLQLKRAFTEQYAWRVSVGGTRLDAGAAGSANQATFEVGATRQGERVQWDISAKQAILPIGLGLLTKQNIGALGVVVGTSEHTTLNLTVNWIRSYPVILPEGTVYAGSNWAQAILEWKYSLSQRWIVSAAYFQARSRNGDWHEWANGNQARLGVIWQSGRL